jgi:hypothetical protein
LGPAETLSDLAGIDPAFAEWIELATRGDYLRLAFPRQEKLRGMGYRGFF